MTIRYQVFVSSTFEDLKAERAEVMQALLELDCIPAGMELFPANDDEQWAFIKKEIEQSDYYLVLIAGKYGSIEPKSEKSYTQLEYEFASSISKPIMSFVLDKDVRLTEDKIEVDIVARQKLEEFKSLAKNNRLCKFWSSPGDLGGKVSRSITQMIKQRPGVGWIRGDQVTKLENDEMLRLRNKVLELEGELQNWRQKVRAADYLSINELESINVDFNLFVMSKMQGLLNINIVEDKLVGVQRILIRWSNILDIISPVLITNSAQNEVLKVISSSFFATVLRAYRDRLAQQSATDAARRAAAQAALDETDQPKNIIAANSIQIDGCQISEGSMLRIRTWLVAAGLVTLENDRNTAAREVNIRQGEQFVWRPTHEGVRYFSNRAARTLQTAAELSQEDER